jgi:hypothetical protein
VFLRTHCNGTKISGEATVQYLIEAAVITGYARGKYVFVTQTPPKYSFTITIIHLPIRLPSLKIVRLQLKVPCFARKPVVCWLFATGGGKNNLFILASNEK